MACPALKTGPILRDRGVGPVYLPLRDLSDFNSGDRPVRLLQNSYALDRRRLLGKMVNPLSVECFGLMAASFASASPK